MDIEQVRKLCLSFPGATEQVQWEDDLVFKVGGKMFAVVPLVPARVWMSLKADAEAFPELTERPGVIPAPYLARAKWIAIESPQTLPIPEVGALLRKSYELVAEKLTRAVRASLVPIKPAPRKVARSAKAKGKTRKGKISRRRTSNAR